MWRLEFSENADRQLSKMDKFARRVIITWLLKNIDGCDNPRALGKGLSADYSGAWRYRVGDYRVLCDIQDAKLVVLAFSVDHRRKVYRR